jgi:peroxiredoxin
MAYFTGCVRTLSRTIVSSAHLLLLGASLVLNVYLGIAPHLRSRPVPALTVGQAAPEITAVDLRKHNVAIRWSTMKQGTIVYLFSPTCVWCRRNEPAIDALVRSARAQDLDVIGLSNTAVGLPVYTTRRHLDYPVYSTTSRAFVERGTPTTFLLSSAGVVKAVWQGAYRPKVKSSIEEKLGITLPAISLFDDSRSSALPLTESPRVERR